MSCLKCVSRIGEMLGVRGAWGTCSKLADASCHVRGNLVRVGTDELGVFNVDGRQLLAKAGSGTQQVATKFVQFSTGQTLDDAVVTAAL